MDTRAIVEWIDPDWRDHFVEVELAAEHYSRWCPEEWQEALKELGEDVESLT